MTTFEQIRIGQTFTFRGRLYEKLALSMASNEEREGCIFQREYQVETTEPAGAAASEPATSSLATAWTPCAPRSTRRRRPAKSSPLGRAVLKPEDSGK